MLRIISALLCIVVRVNLSYSSYISLPLCIKEKSTALAHVSDSINFTQETDGRPNESDILFPGFCRFPSILSPFPPIFVQFDNRWKQLPTRHVLMNYILP